MACKNGSFSVSACVYILSVLAVVLSEISVYIGNDWLSGYQFSRHLIGSHVGRLKFQNTPNCLSGMSSSALVNSVPVPGGRLEMLFYIVCVVFVCALICMVHRSHAMPHYFHI